MLLSPGEVKYIAIADARLRENLTVEKTAELFDVSVSCVCNALRWAKKHRVNNLAAADDLKITIASLQKRLDWLERERKLQEKAAADVDELTGKRIRRPVSAMFLATYLREARALELSIAELKGIYKRTLDVNVTADITTRHIDYSKLSDDDLIKIRELQEKAYVHGSN